MRGLVIVNMNGVWGEILVVKVPDSVMMTVIF